MLIRYLLAAGILGITLTLGSSCSGGLDPALGAALIFEEQITDNIKAQIVLRDDNVLEEEDDDRYWAY